MIRPSTHPRRPSTAGSSARRATSLVRGACLVGWGLASLVSCGRGPEPGERSDGLRPTKVHTGPDGIERDELGIPLAAPVPEAARARIGEFLAAMVPPPLDETSDVHDAWLHRWRALLKELSGEEEAVGHAALHAFCGNVSDYTVTRAGLLTIGASAAPEAAAPLLRELMLHYGYRIDDRAQATLLYAEADPDGFLVDARPFVLRHERAKQTMPDDEFLVRGWVKACAKVGQSPVEVCADVATNLWMQPYARIVAIEALAEHGSDALARGALETCLIESTGDGNVRRKAAQSIQAGWGREDACALLEDVLSKEVDVNFAAFLTAMIHSHCPAVKDE